MGSHLIILYSLDNRWVRDNLTGVVEAVYTDDREGKVSVVGCVSAFGVTHRRVVELPGRDTGPPPTDAVIPPAKIHYRPVNESFIHDALRTRR